MSSRTLPAAITVALLVTACGGGARGPIATAQLPTTAPSATAASPSVATSPASPQPTPPYPGAEAVIDVAAGPRGVAVAAGSIWVASTIGNSLQRVDPGQNRVTATIRLGRPVTLVVLGGQLWASVLNDDPEGDDQVVRIDPAGNTVDLEIEVPVFHNIVAAAGAIWAVDAGGALRRVDPGTKAVTSVAPVGGMTIGIAANDAAVWGIRGDGMAWRLPVSGGELLEVPLGVAVPGRSRVGVAPAAGHVWVAVPGTVVALDPGRLTRQLELSLPGMTLVNDLWVTPTDVWLSANVTDADLGLDGGAVLRLDPATAEVVEVYPLGPESSGVVVANGSVWAVDQHDNVLLRFDLRT